MNTLQEIIVVILKTMCYCLFAENLTEQERVFIKRMRNSRHFQNLQIQTTADGEFVLTWESEIGKNVGCPVTDIGFFFSETGIYNQKERSMRGDVESIFPGDRAKAQVLKAEIEHVKNLFLSFSIDTEAYFK